MSHNQSRATLLVLETCLIVGLLLSRSCGTCFIKPSAQPWLAWQLPCLPCSPSRAAIASLFRAAENFFLHLLRALTADTNGYLRRAFVPQDLQCLPRISAMYVVEDVSIYLDILTEELWAIWERPPISLGYKQILSAACPSESGSLAMTAIASAVFIWDADEPCSVKSCEGSRVVFHSVTTEHDPALVFFCNCGSNC